MARFIEWLLTRLRRERFDIGLPGYPDYLTRWSIIGKRFGPGQKLFLHWFHRGDVEPYLHDHPWPFWSLILWGGYWEWVPLSAEPWRAGDELVTESDGRSYKRHWYGPLHLLRRPPEWKHKVELPAGRTAWTLIWCGEKVRSWGFYCAGGFVPWRQHAANLEAGKSGCGD